MDMISMPQPNSQDDRTSLKEAKARVREHTLVLVGLMGAGKTTVGRRLAKALDIPFVDADSEIEVAAGLTVGEIFQKYGETYFRDGERRVMSRLLEGGPQVLATGGGAFVHAQTRALIAETGISIWLKADLDVLVERVSRRNSRPLLRGKDPEKTLDRLLMERAPIYAQADVTVTSDNGPHSNVVTTLIHAVDAYLTGKQAANTSGHANARRDP